MILQLICCFVNFSWRFMQEEMAKRLEKRKASSARHRTLARTRMLRTAPVTMTGKKLSYLCNKQTEG